MKRPCFFCETVFLLLSFYYSKIIISFDVYKRSGKTGFLCYFWRLRSKKITNLKVPKPSESVLKVLFLGKFQYFTVLKRLKLQYNKTTILKQTCHTAIFACVFRIEVHFWRAYVGWVNQDKHFEITEMRKAHADTWCGNTRLYRGLLL